jgi:hypothetical protein
MFDNRTPGRILGGNLRGRRQAGILTNMWVDEVRKDAAKLHSWPATARHRPRETGGRKQDVGMASKQAEEP